MTALGLWDDVVKLDETAQDLRGWAREMAKAGKAPESVHDALEGAEIAERRADALLALIDMDGVQ